MQPTKIKTEYGIAYDTTLCYTCLSSGRKLNVLGEFAEVYRQICPNSSRDMHSEINLCWECRALLKKIKCFQVQVEKAQALLKSYCVYNILPKSLSNLLSTKFYTIDSYTTQENENECKLNVTTDVKPCEFPQKAIKEENDIDYSDGFDSLEYAPMEEIKDENLPDTILKELNDITIKKDEMKQEQPVERTKRYKMTLQKIKNVVKRVPIEEKELDGWLEKERNSTYYMQLEKKCEKCISIIHTSLEDHNRKFHLKTKTMRYNCEICQECLPSKAKLGAHARQHYFYYRCDACGYSCYNKAHMTHHVQSHARVVHCLECEASFMNTRKFFLHYKAVHRIFICDYCNKKHKTKLALEGHIHRKHIVHRCDECNLSFSSYRSHRDHYLLKHHIERSEASYCVQCNLQFDTVPLFKRHVKTSVAHSQERITQPKSTVPCPCCSNVYARRTNMMNHYRKVHLNKSKHYCSLCEKPFLNRTRYRDHMMYRHEGREKQRKCICYVCGGGFYNNRILSNHLRTHTGERPFECAHCDARFAQKVALDSHVKFIHMKNKRKSNTDPTKKTLGS